MWSRFLAEFSFAGRSSRANWWFHQVVTPIVAIAIWFLIAVIVGLATGQTAPSPNLQENTTSLSVETRERLRDEILGERQSSPSTTEILFYGSGGVLLAAVIWLQWASGVRRLHDHGHSGWSLLIGLIPILGGLYLLIVLGFLGGSAYSQYNRYDELSDENYIKSSGQRYLRAVKVSLSLDEIRKKGRGRDPRAKDLAKEAERILKAQEQSPLPVSMQSPEGLIYRDRYIEFIQIVLKKAQDAVETDGMHASSFDAQLEAWGEETERLSIKYRNHLDDFRASLGIRPPV